MVGGVVGLQSGDLVGFTVGVGVDTLGVKVCWNLLQVCCIYIVEWVQSRGTLIWHSQSKGFVALLLGVAAAWVQDAMHVHFLMW